MKRLKFEMLTILLLLMTLTATCSLTHSRSYDDDIYNSSQSIDPLYLTIFTSKASYSLRELVIIQGAFKQDATPILDGLVGIEVRDSSKFNLPITFRTVSTSNISSNNWAVDFVEICPCDSNGNPKYSFKTNENLYIRGIVKNFDTMPHSISVALSLYDGNLIPLGVWHPISYELIPGGSIPFFFFATRIPKWAYPGNATIYASIFSALPRDGGTPYCPEKAVTFEIKRNPFLTYRSIPITFYPPANGAYIVGFRLSPESISGTYTIYATASKGQVFIQNVTTFSVESSSYPPQASFFYTPIEPYVNMTVTFDASSSTAEGYNDTIVKYEWNFGDGNATATTNPIITHKFTQAGTYLVTLNVTDKEGLWCITSKPITILPPTGPKASFTWTRVGNLTMQFDASTSRPGWNGTSETPIISYKWNFGDGNITTTTNPVIVHSYPEPGNYSVTLTVTDTQNLQDQLTQIVEVTIMQYPPWDINQDGAVNAKDAVILGAHFGTEVGDPGYLQAADINGDGFINAKDAIILGSHFGEIYS